MTTDVLLVYLPVEFKPGHTYGLPPLGVFYLGSSLKQAGIGCSILDANIRGLTFEQTIERIVAATPRLVGLSALTPHVRSMTAVIDRLNQLGYRGRIICGGSHFNDTKGEYFHYADVSYAMHGECELAFTTFVQKFLAGEPVDDVPNLIFRRDGEVVVNPTSSFIADLDTLPFPDLSMGGEGAVYEMVYGRRPTAMSIMCSRGCPYQCTFCDVFSIWGRRVRNRSPANICDEIESLRDRYGITEIFFRDSTFTLNHKWVNALLDEMERRRLDIVWHCNSRVDRVTPELLRRMKSLGMHCMSFGVESGAQEIIDTINKKIDLNQVQSSFEMADRLGIQTTAYFMVGNPGETREMAGLTLDLALKLPITFVDVGPTVAYPGTATYTMALERGYLSDPLWYMKDQAMGQALKGTARVTSPGQLNLPEFPPDEQFAFCKKFLRSFYLRPQAIYRILIRHFSMRVLIRSLKFLPPFLRLVLFR